jgi:hypothetical protein
MAVSGSNYQMLNGVNDAVLYQSPSSTQVFEDITGNCSVGSSIYVESGTYIVNSPWWVTSPNSITMVFQSGAELYAGNGLDSPVIMLQGVNNWNINGVTIDGNAANQEVNTYWSSSPVGIYLGGSNDVVNQATIFDVRVAGIVIGNFGTTTNCGVENSLIYNCGWNGFTDSQATDLNDFFNNNEVYGCSDVGVSSYATGTLITGNYVHDMNGNTGAENSEYGIAVEGGGNDIIEHNTIVSCNGIIGVQGIGIAIGTGATVEGNLVEYNDVSNCNDGINSYLSSGDVITNNLVSGWATGWAFGIIPQDCSNEIISFNTLSSSSTSTSLGSPIYVRADLNCSISDNTITTQLATDDTGITVISGSSYNLIGGNNIQAEIGIAISDSTCLNNIISGNTLGSCTTAISDYGTGTIINP